MPELIRCGWSKGDLYHAYHDHEWGVPVHDDRTWFEFIVLDGAQAGLSWSTILKKREHYRKVFDNFDPAKVALYDRRRIGKLLADPGIIRNRQKVESAVTNAAAFVAVQAEFGTFDDFIWRFTGGRTKQNGWRTLEDVPASTPESGTMSRELKKRGFKFVGSTICYAFMQAAGMVNDHLVGCFRHEVIRSLSR